MKEKDDRPLEKIENDDYIEKKNKMFNIKSNSIEKKSNVNQVNLTSFIMLTRFHYDLINLVKNLCKSNHIKKELIYDILICLNKYKFINGKL